MITQKIVTKFYKKLLPLFNANNTISVDVGRILFMPHTPIFPQYGPRRYCISSSAGLRDECRSAAGFDMAGSANTLH